VPLSAIIQSQLEIQHKSIPEIIDGISQPALRRQVLPGKWSIFENLVHLQTYQPMFIQRIQRILAGSIPMFTPYTAEADPIFFENCSLSTKQVLQNLFQTREQLAAMVAALSEVDLQKIGIHSIYGNLTLSDWLRFFLLHESHHHFTIFKLRSYLTSRA
jgi:hypothetical protein